MDTEKYKPWISANGEYNIVKTDVNRGITIFDLGQNGNSITSTKSPDDVSEDLRNAINDVELKFPDQYAKGWLSSFFLGGKRKTSKRKRNKKHNKTKKKHVDTAAVCIIISWTKEFFHQNIVIQINGKFR